MKVLDLRDKFTLQKYIESMHEPGNVFLVGSAVSIFSPSQLPTGMQLSESIVSFLVCDKDGREVATGIVNDCKNCAFEFTLDRFPRLGELKEFIASEMKNSAQNLVHHRLVNIAEKAKASIVTTNYDDFLEKACEKDCINYNRIVAAIDVSISNDGLAIFKVHGCVNTPTSMILAMQEEAASGGWKARYLRELFDDKRVFVVGYSGMDFDICPILSRSNVREIVWLVRDHFDGSQFKSQHYLAMIDDTRLSEKFVIASGDLGAAFSPTGFSLERQLGSTKLKEFLYSSLSREEAARWRTNFCLDVGSRAAARIFYRSLHNEEQKAIKRRSSFLNGNQRNAIGKSIAVDPLGGCLERAIKLRGSGYHFWAKIYGYFAMIVLWPNSSWEKKRKNYEMIVYCVVYVASRDATLKIRNITKRQIKKGQWTAVSPSVLALEKRLGQEVREIEVEEGPLALLTPLGAAMHRGGRAEIAWEFARNAYRKDMALAAFADHIEICRRFELNAHLFHLRNAALCSRQVVGPIARLKIFSGLMICIAQLDASRSRKILYLCKAVLVLLRLYRHTPI